MLLYPGGHSQASQVCLDLGSRHARPGHISGTSPQGGADICHSDSRLCRDEVKVERISREKSQNVAEELARALVIGTFPRSYILNVHHKNS